MSAKAYDDVITCTLKYVISLLSYYLILGQHSRYVFVCFSPPLGMRSYCLENSVHVLILMGESLVLDQLFRSFFITINGYYTRADLIMLEFKI